MCARIQALRERWDPSIHGSEDKWRQGAPEKRGYYSVICTIRNHLWVCHRYFWNGGYWVTPGHSPAHNVKRYLEESWET